MIRIIIQIWTQSVIFLRDWAKSRCNSRVPQPRRQCESKIRFCSKKFILKVNKWYFCSDAKFLSLDKILIWIRLEKLILWLIYLTNSNGLWKNRKKNLFFRQRRNKPRTLFSNRNTQQNRCFIADSLEGDFVIRNFRFILGERFL